MSHFQAPFKHRGRSRGRGRGRGGYRGRVRYNNYPLNHTQNMTNMSYPQQRYNNNNLNEKNGNKYRYQYAMNTMNESNDEYRYPSQSQLQQLQRPNLNLNEYNNDYNDYNDYNNNTMQPSLHSSNSMEIKIGGMPIENELLMNPNNVNPKQMQMQMNEPPAVSNTMQMQSRNKVHPILINGLPITGLTDYELYWWFEDCQGFVGLRWKKEDDQFNNNNISNADRYNPYAFADFESKETALNAKSRKNGLMIGGKQLELKIVNSAITVTPEMTVYYNLTAQELRRKQRRYNHYSHKKKFRIKLESNHEFWKRKRRERIHDSFNKINKQIDEYEVAMNENYKNINIVDPNVSQLWKKGIEKSIESYRKYVASEKSHYCLIMEGIEREYEFENKIAQLQTKIDCIRSQRHFLNINNDDDDDDDDTAYT